MAHGEGADPEQHYICRELCQGGFACVRTSNDHQRHRCGLANCCNDGMAHGQESAEPAEVHHSFDMGLVAAHQNEITRLRKQKAELLTALKGGKALAYRFRTGEYKNANQYIADLQRWERAAQAAIEAAS